MLPLIYSICLSCTTVIAQDSLIITVSLNMTVVSCMEKEEPFREVISILLSEANSYQDRQDQTEVPDNGNLICRRRLVGPKRS